MRAAATGRSPPTVPKPMSCMCRCRISAPTTSVRADNIPSQPHDQYNTQGKSLIADGHDKIGRIDAISVETGKTLWSWETPASNYSPILATPGGVLFNGGMDRYLRALDQADGKVLWQTRLGSQIFGTPVTFSVGGRQYVAVAAGGGFNGSSPGHLPRHRPAQRQQHGLASPHCPNGPGHKLMDTRSAFWQKFNIAYRDFAPCSTNGFELTRDLTS